MSRFRLTAKRFGCGSFRIGQIDVLDVGGLAVQSSTDELPSVTGSTSLPVPQVRQRFNLWYVALDGGAFSNRPQPWLGVAMSSDCSSWNPPRTALEPGHRTNPRRGARFHQRSPSCLLQYDGVNLCFGDDAPEVDVIYPAVGADGSWEYLWQQSGTEESWQGVLDGSEPFFAGVMTDSTLVRILGTSTFGCGTFMSNEVLIPVWAEVVPGVINAAAEQTICFNTAPPLLEASPAMGGGGNFNLQWLTASGTETVPFAQTPTLSPGALTDTSNYVLHYTNTNGCGTVLSAVQSACF